MLTLVENVKAPTASWEFGYAPNHNKSLEYSRSSSRLGSFPTRPLLALTHWGQRVDAWILLSIATPNGYSMLAHLGY